MQVPELSQPGGGFSLSASFSVSHHNVGWAGGPAFGVVCLSLTTKIVGIRNNSVSKGLRRIHRGSPAEPLLATGMSSPAVATGDSPFLGHPPSGSDGGKVCHLRAFHQALDGLEKKANCRRARYYFPKVHEPSLLGGMYGFRRKSPVCS
jgi:hypothetical protein